MKFRGRDVDPLDKARKALRLGVRALRRRHVSLTVQPGHDPGELRLVPDGGSLPVGWTLVDIEVAGEAVFAINATLQVDYGQGEEFVEPVRLPSAVDGHIVEILHFQRGVHELRLEPDGPAGNIRVGKVTCIEITKSEAHARMASRFARARRWGPKDALRLTKKAIGVWRTEGLGRVLQLTRGDGRGGIDAESYAKWIEAFDTLSEADRAAIERRIAEMDSPPLISIVLPTYNTPPEYLRKAIDSVRAQLYPHWQLCIADDASTREDTRAVLTEYAAADKRIEVVFRPENGHISRASNSALELATGEFFGLLDHDDELAPLALYMMAEAINDNPDAGLLYSDEDKIDVGGSRFDPYFKSDWNPELFRGQNFINHFGVYRRKLVQEVGGFRAGLEGSQDYDLALRVIERLRDEQIVHVPWILYHWRSIPGSTALGAGEKNYALTAAGRALTEHVQRTGVPATVEKMKGSLAYHRIKYGGPRPRVSIIIPTKDRVDLLERAVDSVNAKTDYDDYEIVIVDNRSELDETRTYFEQVTERGIARVLTYDHPFNYSAINNFAVSQCSSPIVALLNNDVEVISPGWLDELVSHAVRPGVGCVGAMLYYPDDRVQHAGVLLGINGVAGHVHRLLPRGAHGYFSRAALTQNYSVVTAACLAVRREIYEEVGGLDEKLQVAFNDVDFCLRVRAKGYRNIWTPHAELYHYESATRGLDTEPRHRARFANETAFMKRRWRNTLRTDPAYNPNLSLSSLDFAIAAQPRTTKPWLVSSRPARRETEPVVSEGKQRNA